MSQPLPDVGGGPVGGAGGALPAQPGPDFAEQLLRQQEEEDGGGKDLIEKGQLGAALPGPQYHHSVGEDVGHGAACPGPALKDAGDQAGTAVAHSAGPVSAAPGQVHTQPGGHAGGSADAQPSLGGKDHHRQGGEDTAGGDDVPHQGELRQGDEDSAAQNEKAGQLPGGELPLLPLVQPGGEGGAVEVDAGAGEQQLRQEKDHSGDLPAPLSQVDEAGGAGERRRHRRHEPAALVQLDIEKGECHREDEDGRRYVPQSLGQPPESEIAEAGAQQGGKAAQPRARAAHHGQPERGAAIQDLRPRQYRREGEADDILRPPHQGRRPKHQPARPGHLLPGLGCL